MEFVVYILYSSIYDKTYTGFTPSLIERFKSHNELSCKGYTTRFRPWTVIYVEIFHSKKDAILREKWLKSVVGSEYILKIKSSSR